MSWLSDRCDKILFSIGMKIWETGHNEPPKPKREKAPQYPKDENFQENRKYLNGWDGE